MELLVHIIVALGIGATGALLFLTTYALLSKLGGPPSAR